MSKYMTITSDRSKKTTLILCALGGWIGIHDFYLGRIGAGIIKLLTMNFCGFGWMVDLAKVALGSYRDNAGAPVRE